MKILYFGGQKSGKSRLSEQKVLSLAKTKPFYVATYDNSYADAEMQMRLAKHLARRVDRFETIEEPIYLDRVIEDGRCYLVDCLSMWLMNVLEKEVDYLPILQNVLKRDADIVFVLNDVSRGIIPLNALSRQYVDVSGEIGQMVAAACDEVYEVVLGLERQLK